MDLEKQFCTCGYKTEWYEGSRDREACPKCRRVMFRLIDKDDALDDIPTLDERVADLEKRVAILETVFNAGE